MELGDTIDCRLAVYGSLAPGRPNHHEVAMIRGTWIPGHVRGFLEADGWGSGLGYPGLRPDEAGEIVPVLLLVSRDLPAHLRRLDLFEGEDYQRTAVSVATDGGSVTAWVYAVHPKISRREP